MRQVGERCLWIPLQLTFSRFGGSGMTSKRKCHLTWATLHRSTKEEHCRRRKAYEKVTSKKSRQFQKTDLTEEGIMVQINMQNEVGIRGVKESTGKVSHLKKKISTYFFLILHTIWTLFLWVFCYLLSPKVSH